MSSLPIDAEHEKMRDLLKRLSVERLDREEARELKQLLLKESQTAMDLRYRKTLFRLIDILNKYIAGEVNLMSEPNVQVSNLV
jgi:hypothetical protein